MTPKEFKKLKVGKTVYTIQDGRTRIKEIRNDTLYAIRTESDATYTSTGRHFAKDTHPSLFLKKPKFFTHSFKDGDPVLVSMDGEKWKRRFFSYRTKYLYFCYVKGCTRWSSKRKTTGWRFCKCAKKGK